jgi:hypothetical protein
MTTFPGSPRLLKGAIVGIDLFDPLPSVILFQYNPQELTRKLQARTKQQSGEGAKAEAFRLAGPPEETISLKVEIDAADALERGDATATRAGIYPQLSALEMLLYPQSASILANAALALLGTIEVVPPEAPMTLFIWGVNRVLPVRLTGFSITEEAYDANLNPIRASVSLDLQVLSYADLQITHPGYHLFLAHQTVKEAMARIGSAGSLGSIGPL